MALKTILGKAGSHVRTANLNEAESWLGIVETTLASSESGTPMDKAFTSTADRALYGPKIKGAFIKRLVR
jgi:hypothetical protein